MSHELRTPLNAIIGFSELIGGELFGPLNAKYREYTSDIQASGEQLLGIISDILDLSKVEAGELDINEEDVSIPEIISVCELMIGSRAEKAGVEITTTLPDGLPLLRADPLRIKQVLLNLLHNAVKFTPEGGKVGVICEISDDDEVRLVVKDTGCGIAEENISLIFDKFGQVRDSHTHAHEGAGLGLAIVKSLIDLHEGSLSITSELDKGTTVVVSFPAERTIRSS